MTLPTRVEMRKQATFLDHVTDAMAHLIDVGRRDFPPVEQHAAGIRRNQPNHQPEERGLAATAGAEQNRSARRGGHERNGREHRFSAVGLGDVFERNHVDAGGRDA